MIFLCHQKFYIAVSLIKRFQLQVLELLLNISLLILMKPAQSASVIAEKMK